MKKDLRGRNYQNDFHNLSNAEIFLNSEIVAYIQDNFFMLTKHHKIVKNKIYINDFKIL